MVDAVVHHLASLAVRGDAVQSGGQEFMGLVQGDGPRAYDYIEYDPETRAIERKAAARDAACPLCGTNGIVGAGAARKIKKA